MIARYPILRQYIAKSGISWSELAAGSGINKFVFHLKMWGIVQWKLTDVVNICCFFRTPNAEHLFVRNHSKSQLLESQGKN